MAKSFILRGTHGETSGFLQHSGDVLRCKARCDSVQGMLLTLCFEGDERQTLELLSDGSEMQWPLEAKRCILCAYVTSEGKLLLWTDERAQRAFRRETERMQREAERERRRAQPREEEATRIASAETTGGRTPAQTRPQDTVDEERYAQHDVVLSADQDATGPVDARTRSSMNENPAQLNETQPIAGWRMPQRRWPPPVCWPSARYVAGMWTESPSEKAVSSSAR